MRREHPIRHSLHAIQLASLTLAAAALLGLAGGTPAAQASTASSAVTVHWNGQHNSSAIQSYQANHTSTQRCYYTAATTNASGVHKAGDSAGVSATSQAGCPSGTTSSGHWSDFKNLTISVSQTRNLTDQTVNVTISGMAASALGDSLNNRSNNFLQLMQCWGPDPKAADFMQTCSYGAYGGDNNVSSTPSTQLSVFNGTGNGEVANRGNQSDVPKGQTLRRSGAPFRTVQGATNMPQVGFGGQVSNGLSKYVPSGSANEQIAVPISSNATTVQTMEVQSASAQPYLGCGKQVSRCWLVVVPRGTHSGMLANPPSAANYHGLLCGGSNSFGGDGRVQMGSPLDTSCSYWQDRIVVPLDFRPVQAACNPSASTVQVAGTELAANVISSWQGALCTRANGATFSLTTNPGPTVRRQVVTGRTGLGLTLNQATASELSGGGSSGRIRYAPIANTGITVAFISQYWSTQITDLKLTPRLLAKLLTMSYSSQIAAVSGLGTTGTGVDYSYLSSYKLQIGDITQDPEFQALNPTISQGGLNQYSMPQLVLLGPQGDGAIRAVWRYLQSDAKARAFLQGQPDNVLPGDAKNSGMTINPYYLPSSNKHAKGGGLPYDLSKDVVNTFPKADQTLAPGKALALKNYRGQQVDALMMAPYASTLTHVTQRILRGDSQYPYWDPLYYNIANGYGAWRKDQQSRWVSPGVQMLGVTDLSSTTLYGLSSARLLLPNADPSVDANFVGPTTAAISKGLTSSASASLSSVAASDPSKLAAGAYPLATTIYAMVNIDSTSLTAKTRGAYGQLLDYAAGVGQTPGQLTGQLPVGYVPLTAAQRAQASLLAAWVRNPPAAGGAHTSAGGTSADAASGVLAGGRAASPTTTGTSTGSTPGVLAARTAVGRTASAGQGQATTAAPPGSGALLVVLGGSLSTLLGSAFLLHRKPIP